MPGLRTDAVGSAGQTTAARPEGEAASRATGSYKEHQVKLVSQQSLVQDALEELTSEFSEEAEKDVSDRDVEDGKKADSLERLVKLQQIKELLETLGDLHKADFFRGLKALLARQGLPADEIRRRAARQFEEPAHQYALLKSYVEALKQRNAPDQEIAAAQQAVEILLSENGPSVHAALNIAETVKEFIHEDLGDHQSLRDAYRGNIHDYESMVAVLDDLLERFGEDDLAKSISFMIQALGAELDADGPSIDRTKLTLIVNDMHRLESLTTILGNCNIVARKARKRGGHPSFSGVSLLRKLIPLQESRWVQANELTSIAFDAGLKGTEAQINFLNELKEVIGLVPEKSFTRDENREKLLVAVKQALEETIAIEKEEEDGR